MKALLSLRRQRHMKGVVISWLVLALVAGMAGCGPVPGPITPIPDPGPSLDLEIRTWYDLDAVGDNLAGHHRLMNDLDATTDGYGELAGPTANGGKGWQPVGAWDPYDYHRYLEFTGTFDGHGYEIRDLFINRPDEYAVGLFGVVDEGGVIKDVGVVNVAVTGERTVGGLVASNGGSVSNCYSGGSVRGSFGVGGLVGGNWGTVSNSYSDVSVACDHLEVGGLVGGNWGSINNSYSAGSVGGGSGEISGKVGGLVGLNEGIVNNSYSTGSVTGNEWVGGLVGKNQQGGAINNSYSCGSVSGISHAGGLVGYTYGGATVSNSFWDIETSGQAASDGGTGKTTAQVQDINTFVEAEWDMIAVDKGETNHANTWNIVDGQTYPFLSWQSVS